VHQGILDLFMQEYVCIFKTLATVLFSSPFKIGLLK